MIDKLSLRIATFIRQNNEQAASMDVLMFSLAVVLNAIFVAVMIIIIAIFTNRLPEALALLASFVTLRFFSGGMHLPTSKLCNFISIGLFVVLMLLPVSYWNAGLVLNSAALAFVLLFAPTKDIMHLNLLGPKYTIHFKIVCVLLVSVNFWIQSPILALAFFSQTLTLTPIAYKGVALFERR
ncbi:hypothetical protein FE782_19195 [Paenibacillus antri]|uniref:Accessory regulator AgrB n=1 Tax=Paenibacillus antri TaxID=2582848 RepID=A0A5R9G2B4_9BACL|nr:accessory gene regulator B family protein [Paenibacillus antri]TLS50497.1 hypothetical protein FE782_19195 [Paenibacillus antri]